MSSTLAKSTSATNIGNCRRNASISRTINPSPLPLLLLAVLVLVLFFDDDDTDDAGVFVSVDDAVAAGVVTVDNGDERNSGTCNGDIFTTTGNTLSYQYQYQYQELH